MSDVDHNSVYHRKMALLQEKLRKSEEERLKLEEKFSVMMKECKEELHPEEEPLRMWNKPREEERLSHLKLQYENFLEEDRKRRDRNDRIMRSLDRIESRAATLNAKSKRLKMLREHYEAYLKRVYPTWKNKSPITTSARNNHSAYSPINSFDQHIESSYAERFTTPFTTNRRNSVSFSDNLASPRLMDISYSPRNYDDMTSPSGFARYQQHTLDREVSGAKPKFPSNVYQKTAVKNGLEYDRGPDSYIRGMNTEFNNIGTLNNSQNVMNGYSEFAGHSAYSNSDKLFTTDTQKYPSAYENREQNISDGKTEIQSPQGKLQLLHENNIVGTMPRSASLADSGKGDLNSVCKREGKDLVAGMAADIEWEQNTSRDLLNLSLTDDGKVSNGPCKTEQLMKHQQNLHVLKMHMEEVKSPVTESNYGDNHILNKDFLEDDVQKQGKKDLSSDYNKQKEIGDVFLHKTYNEDGHTETGKLDSVNSVDNSLDDISIEIGKKIEKALSSEKETIRSSDSPEKQRNLDIIVEETNNTEETHSKTKSVPENTDDISVNDSEILSGAILTEGDDELQYSFSNEAGLNESTQQQVILEEKAVHETALPIKGEQITPGLMPQSADFLREDYHTNFEGNSSEEIQGTYESNIQNGDDNVMYLQQPQNGYETAPTYPENTREMVYDGYNNETVNAQVDEQYLQQASKQEVPVETYHVQTAEFDSGLQQMQTGGGDLNESGIIFDNTQDQNYIYGTVPNAQEDYSPGGETREKFYVDTYESSGPNFVQQLEPNSAVPDQNWGQYNEMTFQGDSVQDTVPSTYQNEIQQNMDAQNLQPGEFTYSQEITGNETQYYMNNLEQQEPYNQNLGQEQYFYGNDVQPGNVLIQDDVSGHQLEYTPDDNVLGQQTYQQPDEGGKGFSPELNQEPIPVMDNTDAGAAISHSKVRDENKVPDISLQQSSEYTENLHTVTNESYERSGNNSEMQGHTLENQNACNSEAVPNTLQGSVHLTNYSETENGSVKDKFYRDSNSMETVLAHSDVTKNKTDSEINIGQTPSTTAVEEVAAEKESHNVQGDVRHLELLDTVSEEVKSETHTNSNNSSNEQYKDISRHQEVVESDNTTKSNEKMLNSANRREQTETSSNKEPSDLEPAKSGEEEYTESFDGGKYHEPTVAYESGIPGYSNVADSSTTEDSSERWTTMPKKTRQQMTLKVQNKKAETTLPPDEDSSDESGQIQPVLHGSQVRATPHADTSEDSEQLGEQKETLHTGGTNTSQTEVKLGRLPARGSSKLPTVSTVMDSDIDSLHLGSESSMT